MDTGHVHQVQKDKQLSRRAAPGKEEEIPTPTTADYGADIVTLQRLIGNSGVQRLLAQGRLQRESACGCVGSIRGERDAQPDARPTPGYQVQRFWDDDEESSDEGGFTDWVGETASGAAEEVGSWFGGEEEEAASSESPDGGWSTDEEAHTLDETEDSSEWEDSKTEGETTAESEDGGVSDSSAEGESDSEAESTEDGWEDWLPWDSDESEEAEGSEEPEAAHEIADVKVECETEEGVGFGGGSGKSISLHGKTVANYNHGKPVPAPFPSSVTVTAGTKGTTKVFSASGTFDAAFKASPSVTLPPVPGGLTTCQQEAVQEFISGPLAAHEQDHVKAFKDNYDGTASLSVNVTDILDTPEMRKRAMENPVNQEDQTRTKTANAASAALDPWNKAIPGLDCED